MTKTTDLRQAIRRVDPLEAWTKYAGDGEVYEGEEPRASSEEGEGGFP